jgi:Cu+-exporting ATPase
MATNQLNLRVDGMHCAGCVASIEKNVSKLDGVRGCQVNLAMKSALVTYDPSDLDHGDILEQIKDLGFQPSLSKVDLLESNKRENRKSLRAFLVALVLTLPLMLVAMWQMFTNHWFISPVADGFIQALIAGVVLFFGGRTIFHDAAINFRHFRANMNSLIAMGTLTAYGWSIYVLWQATRGVVPEYYFDSAAMIVTIILLGRFFESRTKARAGQQLEALIRLQPREATQLVDGGERRIPVEELQPGMRLLVKPGERVPADGTVSEGSPVINESMLTGESLPVDKRLGEEVFGGSVNGNVAFEMTVTAIGEDSYLAQIVQLVAQAQGEKAPVQRLADKVAGVFAPTVIGLALITLAVWWFVAPDSPMLIKSVVSVLIIACPCALGLATPTAILAGTSRAAKQGIIIKGGDVIERLSHLNTIIFDKTGTLTYGELSVVGVTAFEGWSDSRVLSLVAGAESQSEHPVAMAISRMINRASIEPARIRNVETRPGFGLIGFHEAARVVIGNRSLMENEGVTLGPAAEVGSAEMAKGRTVAFVSNDNVIVGLITLTDQLRDEAQEVVSNLKEVGIEVGMISGDNRATAKGIANSAGIESFEAEIRPEQKQIIIESFRRAGRQVAMVGDGINDAPALAEATVGIAIGSGTDVAMETADVVLVRSELRQVPAVLRLARTTMKVIRQNLFWAFAYNVLAIPIAAGVFYPVFGWTLSPMIAAAAMAFSSVFVVSNSLRLNRQALTA